MVFNECSDSLKAITHQKKPENQWVLPFLALILDLVSGELRYSSSHINSRHHINLAINLLLFLSSLNMLQSFNVSIECPDSQMAISHPEITEY